MRENMNSNIIPRLNLLASIFQDSDTILQDLAKRRIDKIQTAKDKDSVKIDISLLNRSNPTLRFYMYLYAFELVSGMRQDFYHAHFLEIEAVLSAQGSKQVFLPHEVIVHKEYEELRFLRRNPLNQSM